MVLRQIAGVVVLGMLLTPGGCRRDAGKAEPADVSTPSTDYLSLLNRGKAYYENGDGPAAAASFEQAVQLIPTEITARLNWARALILARRDQDAWTQVEQILDTDPHLSSVQYLAGLIQLHLQEPRKAIHFFERSARLEPTVPAVYFQLALAAKQDEQWEPFRQSLQTVLSLDERYASAHYQLAQLARAEGDADSFRRHIAAFQRLRTERPDEDVSPAALERCNHLDIEVPEHVHQPDAKPMDVRFGLKSLDLHPRADSEGLAAAADRPLAMLPRMEDGRLPVIMSGSGGHVYRVMWGGEQAVSAGGPIAHMPDASIVGACIADYDNDGTMDIFLFGSQSAALLHGEDQGAYVDVGANSGLGTSGLRDAAWVDFDHDGDVDLLTVSADGSPALWENQGNGRFVDQSEPAGIPASLGAVIRMRAVDMNGDEATDIVFSHSNGPTIILHNDGLGVFSRSDADGDGLTGRFLLVEDLDNDLRPDTATADGDHVSVVLSSSGMREFTLDGFTAAGDLRSFDYDNDGWLDLLITGSAATGSGSVRLFRNEGSRGWRNVTPECKLDELRLGAESGAPLTADLDGDGDTDLLVRGERGVVLAVNNLAGSESGDRHRQLKLVLTGTRSNRAGVGTLVEIRSGGFRLSRTVSWFPVEIGIGDREQLDSVRTIWTNGIVRNDVWVDTAEPLSVREPFVSAGSCPYLYVWDGTDFRFVTDILGASPLGLSRTRGSYVPADTDERLYLGDDTRVVPRDGRFSVQITNELRELLYLDHASLITVDHPSGTEVHPTDRLQPPPFRPSALRTLGGRLDLQRAVDHTGRDWTRQLRQIDGRRTVPPALRAPQLRGLAPTHALTLDFGRRLQPADWVLCLTGWLMWGDAGVNVAASQNADLPIPWPRLDAFADGAWREVPVVVGAPSGKQKTIIVDLSGVLPAGAELLRLSTGLEIYWDRICLFADRHDDSVTMQEAPLDSAKLAYRGFPRQIRPDPAGPILPDPGVISHSPPWRTTPRGWCTPYGDVGDLLAGVDDRYVIANGGDALVIEFAADRLPPRPAGFVRSFFLRCDGWDKDSDYNVQRGDTIEPLPFHGMNDQHYGVATPPDALLRWAKERNRRWVGGRLYGGS